jgi:hypothetical protein
MMTGAQITNPEAARTFIFGGRASFTLKSRKTGAHIAFQIKKAKDGDAYFVRARKNGDDGSGGYTYAGWLRETDRAVRTSKKAHASTGIARDALSWALAQFEAGKMPETLEVWHEGRCCRCNRKLTDPESVALGIGPECRKKGAH